MDKNSGFLLGQLIGLCRATDGNEHLISPSATAVIRECLRAVDCGSGDVSLLSEKVEREKRKMVPDCFVCAAPCGRTSACDLSAMEDGPVRRLKFRLLDELCRRADSAEEKLLYRCLVAVGIGDYEEEDLLPLLQEVSGA